jgi:peptidoglycan/xylan/chitin deacetylase (PgdA/CDA1 family)
MRIKQILSIALVLTGGIGLAALEVPQPAAPVPTTPTVQAAPSSVVILDYHTFLDSHNSSIDFSLEEFALQLDAIKALGYRFVSLEDAISGTIEGNANIVLTIDDGNHSIWEACRKVLEPRGIKPVLFVYPAIILGRVKYAITSEHLAELARDGSTLGAHGYHHNPVTDRAWAKNPKDFMTEIKRPGPALARMTGITPLYFAYPFGVFSRRAEEELKDAGYEWAFAADAKIVPVDFSSPSLDHFAVPRTIVYRWNAKLVLKTLARLLGETAPAAPPTP